MTPEETRSQDREHRDNGGVSPLEWADPQPSRPVENPERAERAEYVWVGPVEEIESREARWRRLLLHLGLFLLTVASTWWVQGPWYSLAIMSILLAHEMGHYLVCRHYGVAASLPVFIPLPIVMFGTMGAVIRMRSRIPSRKVLFDIAAAGPIAGLVLAIPAVIIGLKLSRVIPTPAAGSGLFFLGESPLFAFLSKMVVGPLAEGTDIALHPLAFAGWAGLYVTALNLLPVGQLDGGHVVYGMLGPRARWVSTGAIAIFMIVSWFTYRIWFFLIALLLLMGVRHPPPVDDVTPLGWGRKILGVILLVLFVLSFTLIPVRV